MKKHTLLLFLLCVIMITGCSSVKTEEETVTVTVPNPWKTYQILEEALSSLSFSVKLPDLSPSWKPFSYRVMGTSLVEVVYASDSDGTFTYRKSATDDEISGDYNSYSIVSNATVNGAYITEYSMAEGTFKAASWMYEGHSYYILFQNSQSEDVFLKIVGDFVEINKTYVY